MFQLKRFMAFVAVGLLLVAARFYPSALERAKIGNTVYYGTGDNVTECADAYAYCRVETDGGEEKVVEIINRLRATVLFTEEPEGERIFYCFSPLLPRTERVNGKKINLTIALRGDVVVAGTPLIKGSY